MPNVTPKVFFYIYIYIYTYFRLTLPEEESMSLSVSTFKDLDTIVMKEASCNTDASDDFTTDKKQKCSNNNSPLVTALKVEIA